MVHDPEHSVYGDQVIWVYITRLYKGKERIFAKYYFRERKGDMGSDTLVE